MHLIDSLEFDVALASEERAFDEQDRLQGFLRGPALQVIRSVFDELSPPQEVWRLDRLEVDLGVVSGCDLDAQWEQRLREQLQAQLLRLMQGRRAPADAGPQPLGGPGPRHGSVPALPRPTRAQDDLPALVHYLRRGTLPWHVVLPVGQRLADWASNLLQRKTPALARQLHQARDRQLMLRRLAQQLPPADLAPLAHALGLPAAWPLAAWVDVAARVAPSTAPAGTVEFWRRRLWELVLQQALSAAPGVPERRRLRDALRAAGPRRGGVEPSMDPGPDAVAADLPALLHFLQRGRWPSHPAAPAGPRLAAWATTLLAGGMPTLAQHLREAPHRERMTRRLAQLLPSASLELLAHALGWPAAWSLAAWVDVAARGAESPKEPAAPLPGRPAAPTLPGARGLPDAPAMTAVTAVPAAPAVAAPVDAMRRRLWEYLLMQAPPVAREAADERRLQTALASAARTARTAPAADRTPAISGSTDVSRARQPAAAALDPRSPADRLRTQMEALYALADPARLESAVHGHLRQDADGLRAWLVDAGRQRQTRRWLASSLSAPTWHRLLTLVAPAAAPALQQLLQRRRFGGGWVRLSRQRWSRTSWSLREAALSALLANPPARRDPASLMAATVEQAAQRFHTTAAHVAAVLHASLARAAARPGPLCADFEVLEGWLREQASGGGAIAVLAAAAQRPAVVQAGNSGGSGDRFADPDAGVALEPGSPGATPQDPSTQGAPAAVRPEVRPRLPMGLPPLRLPVAAQAAARPRDREAEVRGHGTGLRASAGPASAEAISIDDGRTQAAGAAATPGPAAPAAGRGVRPATDPPPQPARALARALQQQDATSAWLAWQACEATDPAGAGAQLAALCRQPGLCEALARCLPSSRQLALVARVAPAAHPLLHAWFGRHRGPDRRMAPRDAVSHERAAVWSGWWAAWARAGDEGTAVADLRGRWRVLDEAAARAGARRIPAGDPALPPPRARGLLDAALRVLPSAVASAPAQASVPGRAAAAEAGSPPSAHRAAQPALPPALPALLRQWQAAASTAHMAPALRRAWHLACGSAGARAWLVASLPPARLLALAAQLEPGEAAVLGAWTRAPWWPQWRTPAATGAAAWTLSGWWRLWFARWAAGPPTGAFDRAGALDAWFVHAARAGGQRLPDYLDGLLQRLQTSLASPPTLRSPGSALGHMTAATGTSSLAVTHASVAATGAAVASTSAAVAGPSAAAADASHFVLQRARALSRAARESDHAAASRRAARDRRGAKTPLAAGSSRTAASPRDYTLLSPASAAGGIASPRPAQRPAAPGTRWRPPPAPDLEPGEAVSVHNAGLVLLAGFAPRLFSMLGLLEGRAFVDEDAATRAAHLLQWLVDERLDADEHELVLNKLLCGLPAATPVPRDVVLQPREQATAQQMLQGVIAHWSAIGRTSVQGLRESFLQREGRLSRDEAAWRLRVAPRAFDMLLDRLPWSYTMLKLPWMPEVLHVEWR